MFVYEKLGKKLFGKKNSGKKKFLGQKISGQKNFLGQKPFWVEKICIK